MNLYSNIKNNLNESAKFYYKEFSGAGEIDYVEFETEQEANDYAKKVNEESGNETAVYRIDNDECIALYDALNESEKLKEDDKSYSKGVNVLDKLYSNPEYEALWDKKFNELVPKSGKAKTTIGEIMRGFSSLSHAYYQNGDTVNSLYRQHFNSGYLQDAHDLYKAVKELGDRTLIDLTDKMFNTRRESAYCKYMAAFYEYFINNYLSKENINESEDKVLDSINQLSYNKNKKLDKYMAEWESICQAFCKKIGAKLLFVNINNFGYEDKDGNLVHMYADELEQYLKNNKI